MRNEDTITYNFPWPTLALICSPFHVKSLATWGIESLFAAYDNISISQSSETLIPVPSNKAFRFFLIRDSSSCKVILIMPSNKMFSFRKFVGNCDFFIKTTLYVFEKFFKVFLKIFLEGGVVIGGNTRGNAREVLKVLATCAANDVLLSICRVLSETEINDIQWHVAILSVYIFKMSFLNIIFKKTCHSILI